MCVLLERQATSKHTTYFYRLSPRVSSREPWPSPPPPPSPPTNNNNSSSTTTTTTNDRMQTYNQINTLTSQPTKQTGMSAVGCVVCHTRLLTEGRETVQGILLHPFHGQKNLVWRQGESTKDHLHSWMHWKKWLGAFSPIEIISDYKPTKKIKKQTNKQTNKNPAAPTCNFIFSFVRCRSPIYP